MRLLRVIARHLRSLFRGGRLDADTREELQQHYRHQIAANLAAGMAPEEARRAAVLDIGGMDQLTEASRDARGLAWWDTLRGDLRYAFRQIRKRPGFSAAAILTLAIGVGATAAVFAVVDAVLLRPLPYPSSDRLYSLYEINRRGNIGRTNATPMNFMDWRDQSKTFVAMAGHVGTGFTLTGRGEAFFTRGQLVTPNLLDVLQVKPLIGRTFRADESDAGNHRVVLLTHALWMSYFGGDRSVVDTVTTINGEPYQIAGVLPPGFAYPNDEYALLVPLVMRGTLSGAPPINRGARYVRVVARLADGADEARARTELDAIGKRLATEYAESNENVTIGMTQLTQDVTRTARTNLVVVFVAVGVVLLIACINVAGLSVARANARGRELAVRSAIGASRGRLVRQLATEGLVLFAIGGAAGLAIAAWSVRVLAASLPAGIPRVNEIAVDGRFLIFGALLVVATGLISSVLPALQMAKRGPASGLAGLRGAISAARSVQRTRGVLIVAQVAAAIVLLTGAALALRSFQRVNAVEKGFDTSHATTFSFVLRETRFPAVQDMRAFLARANDALEAAPGIEAVGTTTHLPLGDNNLENSFTVDGSALAAGQDPPIAGVRGVSGRFITAVGAHLLQGRDLAESDTASSQPVAIVTSDFARRHITSGPALGARLKMGDADSDDPWRTVVGVIADVRHGGLDREPRPEVWLPFAQLPQDLATRWLRGVNVVARTSPDIEPESAIPVLRAVMRGLDAELPLVSVRSMAAIASSSTANRRLETSLLTGFAAIALALAAVGLFGVLAYYVTQHMQEFGVRLALGATPSGLLGLVMRRGLMLLGIGLAIGLPGAVLMGRGMATLLFDIEPLDPVALGSAIATLTVVTVAACALPARRAMRTDPLIALRND